jgi:hypothetical protein
MRAVNMHSNKLASGLKNGLVRCAGGFLKDVVVHGIFCKTRACYYYHPQGVDWDMTEERGVECRVEFCEALQAG